MAGVGRLHANARAEKGKQGVIARVTVIASFNVVRKRSSINCQRAELRL
jgi:hypothetical protein